MVFSDKKQLQEHMSNTPFVQTDKGTWRLNLVSGKNLEWGHRFDPGIGYRVYIKYDDLIFSNCMLPDRARTLANMISQREKDETILNIGIRLKPYNSVKQSLGSDGLPGYAIGQD